MLDRVHTVVSECRTTCHETYRDFRLPLTQHRGFSSSNKLSQIVSCYRYSTASTVPRKLQRVTQPSTKRSVRFAYRDGAVMLEYRRVVLLVVNNRHREDNCDKARTSKNGSRLIGCFGNRTRSAWPRKIPYTQVLTFVEPPPSNTGSTRLKPSKPNPRALQKYYILCYSVVRLTW